GGVPPARHRSATGPWARMFKRVRHLRLAIQTARCAVLLRRRGVRAGLVTCEGRLPVVHTGGRARIGRLAVRGFTAPVELGAVDGGELTIGGEAVVAAGAVVTGDVPARSLAAGNPARVVRTLRADEGWRRP